MQSSEGLASTPEQRTPEGEGPEEGINEFGVFKEQKGQWSWELGSWRKLKVMQQM